MTNASNDNTRAATAGEVFFPEMNQRHDGRALFVSQVGYRGYTVKWLPERHDAAVAAFKRLRITPRDMECFTTVKGERKWRCSVTWAAGRKLIPLAAHEALL
jgi:hypothetical protein